MASSSVVKKGFILKYKKGPVLLHELFQKPMPLITDSKMLFKTIIIIYKAPATATSFSPVIPAFFVKGKNRLLQHLQKNRFWQVNALAGIAQQTCSSTTLKDHNGIAVAVGNQQVLAGRVNHKIARMHAQR